MDFVYNDGGRHLYGYKGETGDCVARAVTIASGKPYCEVYGALSAGNSTERRTKHAGKFSGKKTAAHGIDVRRKWFREYMQSLGFVWTPTMNIGQGCKVHLRDGELPMGKLVVSVSRHFTAVIDGTIHDTHDPQRDENRCVYGYWRLA